MRSEIKIYYTHHFGSFDPLSLKDIQELCNYEEGLNRLPELEYKKTKKTTTWAYNDKHIEMQAGLQIILEYLKN